jgi:choline monooxygenase
MNDQTHTQFIPTLNASDYFDQNRFTSEMEKIFQQEWIYVLHESQLPEPGSYQTFEIGTTPLLFVRGVDGGIRGFYNVCVHRGHLLAKGSGKATHFTCPYHAWTYNCEGRLRGARGVHCVDALPDGKQQLVPVEVDCIDGFVFVRLSSGGPSLNDLFGGFFAELRERLPALSRLHFAKRFVAEVDGNWKIMVENYLECYHCSPTHPALVDLMRVKEFEIVQSPYHLSTRAPAGRPDNTAYKYTLKADSQVEFSGWWLWPNATFNIFPGQQNLLVFHMLPISAEKSIGYCDYFFIDGKVDEEAQALMDWEGNVLEKEDNELIVSAHKGMKSGALSCGVFVMDNHRHDFTEAPLVHFNDLVSRAIKGKDALHPQRSSQ